MKRYDRPEVSRISADLGAALTVDQTSAVDNINEDSLLEDIYYNFKNDLPFFLANWMVGPGWQGFGCG